MADRRDLIQSAERLVARGKLQAAIKEYRKILGRSPEDTTTLNRLGDLYARLDEVDEAVAMFRQIAQHYAKDGFFVKAIAILKKILRLDPTQIDIYETLADLYHRQGLISEARAQYQVVADYYRSHHDLESAARIHQRLAELEPHRLTHRLKLAEIYEETRSIDRALVQYRRIAEQMLERGRVDDALRVFLRALDIGSQDLGFVTDAVLLLREKGDASSAARALAAAVERNPEARRVGRLTAMAEGRPATAEEEATTAPGADPSTALPHAPSPEVDREPTAEEVETLPDSLELELAWPGAAVTEEEAAATGESAAPAALELELEALESAFPFVESPAPSAIAPAAPPAPAAEAAPLWIDLELLERSADEVTPARRAAHEDLIAEAEVFAKYGLADKASARLREVLEIDPDNLEGYARLIAVHLERGEHDRVEELAGEMARRVGPGEGPALWQETARQLLAAGYLLGPDGFVQAAATSSAAAAPPPTAPAVEAASPPAAAPPEPEAAATPAAEEAPAAPRAKRVRQVDLASWLADLEQEVAASRTPLPSAPAAPRGSRIPAPPGTPPPSTPASPAPADPAAPLESLAEELADLEWLAPAQESDGEQRGGAAAFEAEDEFFDLAAELEKELGEDAPLALGEDGLSRPVEQSLEQIVEGLKKGVEETLSPKDYDTHYNLGIAYLEMGLLDEAIGEFQLAAKSPPHLVDCCSMLGQCFLEKGFPELAVKWYRRGLDSPLVGESDQLGLLYSLGDLYVTIGDRQAAFQTFLEIYGSNSNYRDVVARIQELDPAR